MHEPKTFLFFYFPFLYIQALTLFFFQLINILNRENLSLGGITKNHLTKIQGMVEPI